MNDFIVIGTDTDAGKTTFALLWMSAFGDEFAYWKPLETGESDTEKLRAVGAQVHEPLMRFAEPVAPPLAAKHAGKSIPSPETIVEAKPKSPLLIETFGGPLSPLNDYGLQISLIRRFRLPAILVASSAIGAVTRTLTTLRVLRLENVDVRAVVLIGPRDEYASEKICCNGNVIVASLAPPQTWDAEGIRTAALSQISLLRRCRQIIEDAIAPTESILVRDARTIWHPYTSLRDPDPPLPVVAAENEFLHLEDGRTLIDGISSWWTILHGHWHPRLTQALQRASQQIDHVLFAGATHPYAVECAELLLKTAPWPGGRVFFSDNGSTAVEVALKMAYQFWFLRGEPQRKLFVGLEGGYHGDTFGAMAISRDPVFFGRFEPLLFQTERVPLDANRLDELLSRRASEVAAVIVEPLIQGAGGMKMYSPQTLQEMVLVAKRHGALFIVDEVMTSCRIGAFWAHTSAAIVPDLICAAKTLAGGTLPIAATLASPEIVAAFDTSDRSQTFFHGHSFTAHPLACAVAVENLKMIAEGWLRHTEHIRRKWDAAAVDLARLPRVRDVRYCGSILAVEVDAPGGYLADVARAWRRTCVANGVMLRPLGNVLYAMPPLCTSDESLDRILFAVRAAIETTRD